MIRYIYYKKRCEYSVSFELEKRYPQQQNFLHIFRYNNFAGRTLSVVIDQNQVVDSPAQQTNVCAISSMINVPTEFKEKYELI